MELARYTGPADGKQAADLTPRRARIQKHTVSIESVTRLLDDVIAEREWTVREAESIYYRKVEANSELRKIERQMADLERQKAELEYQMGTLTAREDELKENGMPFLPFVFRFSRMIAVPVAFLDNKISVISQESAGFERRIRTIKGNVGSTGSEGPGSQRTRQVSDMCTRALYGHEGGVLSLDFDFPHGTLVTGSADHTVRVWDLSTFESSRILVGHTGTLV